MAADGRLACPFSFRRLRSGGERGRPFGRNGLGPCGAYGLDRPSV